MTERLNKLIIFTVACLIFIESSIGTHARSSIKILVNDSPISSYDISQRSKLYSIGSPEMIKKLKSLIKSKQTQDRFRKYMIKNNPRSKAEAIRLQKRFIGNLKKQVENSFTGQYKKRAIDELINEKLMIQEAKKMGLRATKEEVNKQLQTMANRSAKKGQKGSVDQFLSAIRARGISRSAFVSRIDAAISWQKVIRRKYGREVALGIENIEREIARNTKSEKTENLDLRKIIISDEKQKPSALLSQAQKIQARFAGCASIKQAVAPFKSARIVNLGLRPVEKLEPPANIILAKAQTGQISPPNFTKEGVEMYAVCNRQKLKLKNEKDQIATSQLRQSEFQKRSKRYLRDLRQDALIEYR